MYVDQPEHEFASELKTRGVYQWVAEDLVALERIKATAIEETPSFASEDIEKICGHPPETFEEYLGNTELMTEVEAGPENPANKQCKETPSA